MTSLMPQSAEQGVLATRRPAETDLSSRELRERWAARIRREAVFSARTTCRAYVDSIKSALMAVASRSVTPDAAERRLKGELEKFGYTPKGGFAGKPPSAHVPPALPGTMTDLGSSRRIQLIIDTNVKRARSMGQMAAGENPVFLMANPAWRLERTGARKKPRGDWRARWAAAGNAVGWKGALRRQFVALKSSPIWQALGDGAGGYSDTLSSPFPPFAFGSGLAWTNVGRREWRRLCEAEGVADGLDALKDEAKAMLARGAAEAGVPAPTEKARAVAERTGAKPYVARTAARHDALAAVEAMGRAVARARDAAADAQKSVSEALRVVQGAAAFGRGLVAEEAAALAPLSKSADDAVAAVRKIRDREEVYRRAVEARPLPSSAAEQSAYDRAVSLYANAAASVGKYAAEVGARCEEWRRVADRCAAIAQAKVARAVRGAK